MDKLKSIEVHDAGKGLAFIKGVYIRAIETVYAESDRIYRAPLSGAISHSDAKHLAQRYSQAANVPIFDYIDIAGMVPLREKA